MILNESPLHPMMMDSAQNDTFRSERSFVAITVVSIAGVLFFVPLIAMQFTGEVNWGFGDFAVWGALLAGASAAFLWSLGKLPRRYWFVAGFTIAAIFIFIWAELAVGVFTNLGS